MNLKDNIQDIFAQNLHPILPTVLILNYRYVFPKYFRHSLYKEINLIISHFLLQLSQKINKHTFQFIHNK